MPPRRAFKPLSERIHQNYRMDSIWERNLKRVFSSSIALIFTATLTFSNSEIVWSAENFEFVDNRKMEVSTTKTIELLELLENLTVKGRAPKTGYSRAAFGPQWADVDRNGCDTRNDILKRDLTDVVFRIKTRDCVVERGRLLDPFSNTVIDFQRGEKTSMLVQIDHVVSLSNAWQTGMFRESARNRVQFANDPMNLLAVKGNLNSQKGDGDVATWLPPNKSFRCEYVGIHIKVKAKYNLWLTKPEKEAMLRILGSC